MQRKCVFVFGNTLWMCRTLSTHVVKEDDNETITLKSYISESLCKGSAANYNNQSIADFIAEINDFTFLEHVFLKRLMGKNTDKDFLTLFDINFNNFL